MKATIAILLLLSSFPAQTATCNSSKLLNFSDFKPDEALATKPKMPVLRTRVDRRFRTAIREAAKKGANFSGHYAVAVWGCGTGCHDFAIVDLRSGRVFDTPFRDVNFHTPPSDVFIDSEPEWFCFPEVIKFRKDSALLVVEGCLGYKQCGRTYFRMGPTGLKQIKYDPDLLPGGKVAPL